MIDAFSLMRSSADERQRALQLVQPGLIGLIDGTVSTLAPIFATAFLAGTHAALLVGLAAALGAAISMGLSEALSDDGSVTGRGDATSRGIVTGVATFAGGAFHTLPFIIPDVATAVTVAGVLVAFELVAIAVIRRRFMQVSLGRSLVQVAVGGMLVVAVGVAVGQA